MGTDGHAHRRDSSVRGALSRLRPHGTSATFDSQTACGYSLATLAVGAVASIYARIETPALPPLNRSEPVLVVGNHRSMFDLLAATSIFRRWSLPVRFLVKEDYFERRLMGTCLRNIDAIPVNPEIGLDAIRTASHAMLSNGQNVAIAPEGSRIPPHLRTDGIAPFKPGVSLLVRRAKPQVLLLALVGTDAVWPIPSSRPSASPLSRPTIRAAARRSAVNSDAPAHQILEQLWLELRDLVRLVEASAASA